MLTHRKLELDTVDEHFGFSPRSCYAKWVIILVNGDMVKVWCVVLSKEKERDSDTLVVNNRKRNFLNDFEHKASNTITPKHSREIEQSHVKISGLATMHLLVTFIVYLSRTSVFCDSHDSGKPHGGLITWCFMA